jgi:hypothetical protein
MATKTDAWSGTVAKKSRALLDGSNLYRRLTVQLGDGSLLQVKVDRGLWRELEPGDRIMKREGEKPQRG